MRFKYSPDVDILMVYVSDEPLWFGEDNEAVIVHHGKDGAPLALEIMDASQFVMFANASLLSGQEVTNPNASENAYSADRDAPVRAIPRGDADLRFNYLSDRDVLIVKFGGGVSDICRRSQDLSVFYSGNELPMRLEIPNGQRFVLSSLESVLLRQEVSVA